MYKKGASKNIEQACGVYFIVKNIYQGTPGNYGRPYITVPYRVVEGPASCMGDSTVDDINPALPSQNKE